MEKVIVFHCDIYSGFCCSLGCLIEHGQESYLSAQLTKPRCNKGVEYF